jgi:hypothetical protein
MVLSNAFDQNLTEYTIEMAYSLIRHLSTGRANPMSCYGRLAQGKVDAVPRRECTLSNQISHRFSASPLVVSVAFNRTTVELTRRERTLSTQTFRWLRKLCVLV